MAETAYPNDIARMMAEVPGNLGDMSRKDIKKTLDTTREAVKQVPEGVRIASEKDKEDYTEQLAQLEKDLRAAEAAMARAMIDAQKLADKLERQEFRKVDTIRRKQGELSSIEAKRDEARQIVEMLSQQRNEIKQAAARSAEMAVILGEKADAMMASAVEQISGAAETRRFAENWESFQKQADRLKQQISEKLQLQKDIMRSAQDHDRDLYREIMNMPSVVTFLLEANSDGMSRDEALDFVEQNISEIADLDLKLHEMRFIPQLREMVQRRQDLRQRIYQMPAEIQNARETADFAAKQAEIAYQKMLSGLNPELVALARTDRESAPVETITPVAKTQEISESVSSGDSESSQPETFDVSTLGQGGGELSPVEPPASDFVIDFDEPVVPEAPKADAASEPAGGEQNFTGVGADAVLDRLDDLLAQQQVERTEDISAPAVDAQIDGAIEKARETYLINDAESAPGVSPENAIMTSRDANLEQKAYDRMVDRVLQDVSGPTILGEAPQAVRIPVEIESDDEPVSSEATSSVPYVESTPDESLNVRPQSTADMLNSQRLDVAKDADLVIEPGTARTQAEARLKDLKDDLDRLVAERNKLTPEGSRARRLVEARAVLLNPKASDAEKIAALKSINFGENYNFRNGVTLINQELGSLTRQLEDSDRDIWDAQNEIDKQQKVVDAENARRERENNPRESLLGAIGSMFSKEGFFGKFTSNAGERGRNLFKGLFGSSESREAADARAKAEKQERQRRQALADATTEYVRLVRNPDVTKTMDGLRNLANVYNRLITLSGAEQGGSAWLTNASETDVNIPVVTVDTSTGILTVSELQRAQMNEAGLIANAVDSLKAIAKSNPGARDAVEGLVVTGLLDARVASQMSKA